MAIIKPTRQSYTLPRIPTEGSNPHPVSSSDIGNLYTVAQGQSLTVATASDKPRQVSLYNVGSVPLILSTQNRAFPLGLRLGVGDMHQLVTSAEVWVAAPAVDTTVAYHLPLGYVSVSVAN